MRHVEISEFVAVIPVPVTTMTRSARLLRWANLIRQVPHPLHLCHALEHMTPFELARAQVKATDPTPFGIAAGDSTFRAHGLSSTPSIQDIMSFFEITQAQLHEFSCDCGGAITSTDMADRITSLTF